MPNANDVQWFKSHFQSRLEGALAGTPLTVDFLTAIACQESGEVWPTLRHDLPETDVLRLCVGDTLDSDKGRKAFPRDKAALLAAPRGEQMFDLAHESLVEMARHVQDYATVARRPDKFCHGFGIFQRDLQFFKDDPDYFLDQRYAQFDDALDHCLNELKRGLKTLGLAGAQALDDQQLASVGIAYNTGGFNPKKGLRQGYFDGKRYYGENLLDFIQLAHTVPLDGAQPQIAPPAPGLALVPPPSTLTASGAFLRVDTRESTLRVRSEPLISEPAQANVIGNLPDGHPVRAVTGRAKNGFREIETSLNGALLHGFVAQRFLVTDKSTKAVPITLPAPSMPATGIVAVDMPRKPGRVTRRIDPANAHSLNEPGQPQRNGENAEALRSELAAIIDWLGVDNVANKRYQPHDGLTFCNIYCHDYCALAGVYLPRVWWTSRALLDLSQDKDVAPLIGATITEMRANDLFRWLRDFGNAFGWRQTGTLSKLQQFANQGAVALIVARRKEDGKSGHIVAVVPEDAVHGARRDASGAVIAPLQSQAGARNFAYGTGKAEWWNDEQFAESAFWIHA
ncbi:hypothetical protein [Pseudomonas putida]|uniref:SH3 domain-containing protein n=1 Tax=Pseudomonas putida TaxID=303 RepID=A0A6I6XVB3_PSEPU|nr:hypothetical protein [Pseudomonas putida]QHG65330.1 hypothetical protein C2H86_13355 [Pseudomonas putida]